MKTKLTQSVLMLFLVVGLFSVGARRAEGKSVTWSDVYRPGVTLLNSVSRITAPYDETQRSRPLGVRALISPNITISYAFIIKDTNENLIDDLAMIPIGTRVRFVRQQAMTDISWFGTGYAADSPYGSWILNASYPATPICSADNLVGIANDHYYDPVSGYNSDLTNVYIPFSVNPPVISITHSGSATLSCISSGFECTVVSSGTINSVVNIATTNGKFYYGYDDFGRGGGCITGSVPLFTCQVPGKFFCIQGSTAIVSIPAQTISFNLTAVSNNNPPATPTLSVDAPSKDVNTDFIFTTSPSTDPDNDTIRYGFDWNNDGTVDQLVPSSGFVASGTPQSAPYQWPIAGTYTVRVHAEDNRGGVSGWSLPVSVMVNALPPNPIINSFTINGSTGSVNLIRGDMRNIAWTVSNATSCGASSGDIWSGNKSIPTGNDALPANVTTPHTLDCVNGIGVHTSSTIQVNVSCTPATGTFGSCNCATETKTRMNTSALCISVVESATCDVDEKKACRNFTWTEGAP